MTYRDRRAAKAERLRTWADGRDAKASAAFDSARTIADGIPFGQPILVGHHSEKRARRDADRISTGMRNGIEHSAKADAMRSRAANIDAAAKVAIYSDDEDAVDRLVAKIAGLEAERAEVVAYNRAVRKTGPTPELLGTLSAKRRADLASLTRIGMARPDGSFPTYVTSNLSGNISRLRARLERLER